MPRFFQSVCSSLSVRSREEIQQLVSLLQLLNFNLFLTGELNDKTCSSVGKVLPLCGSKVDLILTDSRMSVRGAAVLFRSTTQLHSLRQEPEEQRLFLTSYLLLNHQFLMSIISVLLSDPDSPTVWSCSSLSG